MTHDELVARAERWLCTTAGCGFVLTDRMRAATNEQPDAIGWRSGLTILVECKVSRSDFLGDRNKPFRQAPETGMGAHRFYLCPPELIQPEELPAGWGLLWAYPRKVQPKAGMPGSALWGRAAFEQRNRDAELQLMASALRRLQLRGVLEQVYDKPWQGEGAW